MGTFIQTCRGARRSAFAALTALTLSLSLTACGRSSDPGTDPNIGPGGKADDLTDGGVALDDGGALAPLTLKPDNLPGQGWTEAEADTMHHIWTGARLVPIPWLEALTLADGTPFLDPSNTRKFGLIPDPKHRDVPIGFAESTKRYYTQYYYGQTCAACHTNEIHYKGSVMRIEGAGSMGDFFAWVQDMGKNLEETAADSGAFEDFGHEVYPNSIEFFVSFLALGYAVDTFVDLMEPFRDDGPYAYLHPVKEGWGRADAVGRSFIGQAYYLDRNALRPADAPVSTPPIWGTAKHDYTHYTGSERSSLIRNVTQTLGSVADFDVDTGRSDVQFENLRYIDETYGKLEAPVWPQKILGNIDLAKATRGRTVYQAQCASCHEPKQVGDELQIQFFFVASVMTDTTAADNIINATLDGSSVGLGPNATAMEISEVVANRVVDYFFAQTKATAAEKLSYTQGRPTTQTVRWSYKAMPLEGVWATPPYLHNGSVQNLWELLLAPEERKTSFALSPAAEYDPVHVGYEDATGKPGAWTFDTAIQGNRNTGHAFGTYLSEADRWDLIEYLKTK